jgi:hypothetical protein
VAEPLAYGLLALRPQQFARLTVWEFSRMVEGALWREERQRDILAWHAANVMAGFGAKTKSGMAITARALLGRDPVPLIPPRPEPPPAKTYDATPTPKRAAPVDPIRARLEALAQQGLAVRVK